MFKRIILLVLTSMVTFGLSSLAQEVESPASETGTTSIAFIITDTTLRELRKQELPEDLLTTLETLQDTLFNTEELFVTALEEAIGKEAFEEHKSLILKLAYVYDSTDRREPFKSPFEPEEEDQASPIGDECPDPFGKYDVGQFQIIGILLGEPGDRAKIKAPDGESYTITLDSCIGRYAGKVIAISENCVTVRETKRYQKGDEISIEEPETDLCLKATDN